MRFRPHRGLFIDSMKECVTVHSLEELQTVWDLNFDGPPPTFVRFQHVGFDDRPPWNADTFYVIVREYDGREAVIGMTDTDQFA